MTTTSPTVTRLLEQVIEEAVPGEVVVHYDVIIKTRSGPDLEEIHTYRISMPGSDPDLTLGTLLRVAGIVPPVNRR